MTTTHGDVPLNALAPGVAAIREELNVAIARVLDRGWFLMGPETDAFEREFAAYHGRCSTAWASATGTDASVSACCARGQPTETRCWSPPTRACRPWRPSSRPGRGRSFCEVDPTRQAVSPEEVERRTGPRTRVLLVVHLYGQPASIRTVEAARAGGLLVLEDCAQAHGARTHGQLVGTLGDAAAFSFYPTKNLGALGDGGLVLSPDAGVIERARLLRQYGWRSKYVSELQSMVSRLDELQAAVLRVKLPISIDGIESGVSRPSATGLPWPMCPS